MTDILSIKDLSAKRENLVYMAKSAEVAERYEDMCKIMKLLVQWEGTSLSSDERNLLSVAYKNVIGMRRASCRTLKEYKNSEWLDQYKTLVEDELKDICKEILGLLNETLIPDVTNEIKKAKESEDANDKTVKDLQEALVFYLKMTGDYHRYLAEIFTNDKENVEAAQKTYKQALEIAEEHLIPTHPIRLGLALNFSVCYYEILKDQTKACELAKSAFDAAISKLDSIDEASYKDSTLIMQLLRDNLTLWTTAEATEDVDGGEDADA
eukprot:CAMPEP_0197519290 /NCGR_PEP_ID=MMETSP1318-20131121/4548_1 /TAXON_ID=552666 /ORGANISM="Partenskyella glossopodia, Strain RCC365" /LENGTH=266 /DNA_ID=CAMNT_0043070171 /DNA_START=51 /DNA_END=851 /DNA_ORIENTATION=+